MKQTHNFFTRFIRKKISGEEMLLFFQQFNAIIAAGIPLIQTCDLLASSQGNFTLQNAILTIKQEVLAGKSLHQSFQIQHLHFNEFIQQLIKVGEQTGKLELMLRMITQHLEKQIQLKRRIKQALFYPIIVLLTGLLITLGLLFFVIPRFALLFSDHLDQLPLITRFLFSAADFFQHALNLLLVALLITLACIYRRYLLPIGHRLLIKLPLIQDCRHKLLLVRFAQTLSITYSAGIPIIESLKLSAGVCRHPDFSKTVASLRASISTGTSLHQAMAMHSHSFPMLMLQMIKTGEETGLLDTMLNNIAQFYEDETSLLLQRLSQLLEPLIMVILGVLIGGLVLGMYLPLFKLGSLL